MISVIITVHEPLLKHLRRCIASVMWQLADADELIVVSDRIDVQQQVYDMVGEMRLANLLTLRQNRAVASGECATRNLGLANASQEWIKFLDADDLLAPFALPAFRALHAKGIPDQVAVVAGAQLQVHNGILRGWIPAPDIAALITKANPILPSMCFVRRAAANAVEGFDERIDFEGDWDFWLRLRQADWKFARMQPPACCYWIDDAERQEKEATRTHQVEGMDVRDYFAKTYGITPQR